MKVRFYGKLAEVLGPERCLEIDTPCTLAELRGRLAAECPEAAEALASERVRASVGDELVPDSHVVHPGEAVELLAPVSGG
ncbi:MAG TPA: MoaD/ThiS family protein [Sphingomicrobium sp.]|nr:MoaD/ThiS family protein [Sphingomicrobium sp.]